MMKKDELIKKAAEHGITIDETQAEKYLNLSDEELANLEIAGGKCGEIPPYQSVPNEKAATCPYYERSRDALRNACQFCKHAYSVKAYAFDTTEVKCTNQAAWEQV
ncbi:MAG: hypothetical protein LBL80_05090 [Ruminococcus sp.]|jgi:hypothetical protein|nr:hypothetical protein [Ruminococcus sp.]